MTQFGVAQVLADKFGDQPRGHGRVHAASRTSARRRAPTTGLFAKRDRPGPDQGRRGREHRRGARRPTRASAAAATMEIARRAARRRRRGIPTLAPDITAGNSSQMTDGAAAMLIADRATAERLGLPVRAGFRHFAVAGDDPVLVLSAPNPVTRKLLERTGHDDRRLRRDRVQRGVRRDRADVGTRSSCPTRRATTHAAARSRIGHPLGASGVRLMTTLLEPPRGHRRPLRLPDDVRRRRPGQRHRHRAHSREASAASRGSLIARSAMMFFCTSVVPAPIDV